MSDKVEGTRKERWADAANEAVDAIARLIELQEGMESRANFIDLGTDDIQDNPLSRELILLDEVVNLNLKDALDIIEEAVVIEIPKEEEEGEKE